MKCEDQREAKACQEKQKRAFLNINMAQVVDLLEEESEVKPARFGVGFITSMGLTQKLALIDIGASHNLMSYETWAALEMPTLNPTNAQVKAVNSTVTQCLGT
ncbi:retroviral-like aspartic protease [Empedobacter sp. 189-2]|nr:retroviral-like aspartic protease [Empedobacter sp. 189-2]